MGSDITPSIFFIQYRMNRWQTRPHHFDHSNICPMLYAQLQLQTSRPIRQGAVACAMLEEVETVQLVPIGRGVFDMAPPTTAAAALVATLTRSPHRSLLGVLYAPCLLKYFVLVHTRQHTRTSYAFVNLTKVNALTQACVLDYQRLWRQPLASGIPLQEFHSSLPGFHSRGSTPVPLARHSFLLLHYPRPCSCWSHSLCVPCYM